MFCFVLFCFILFLFFGGCFGLVFFCILFFFGRMLYFLLICQYIITYTWKDLRDIGDWFIIILEAKTIATLTEEKVIFVQKCIFLRENWNARDVIVTLNTTFIYKEQTVRRLYPGFFLVFKRLLTVKCCNFGDKTL